MMPAPKDSLKEFVENVWPKTKKELVRATENAKKMLDRGEDYLRQLSEKSVDKTKKISLSLKKEKLYYDLGKAIAATSLTQISTNKKVTALLRQIKSLEREIKK